MKKRNTLTISNLKNNTSLNITYSKINNLQNTITQWNKKAKEIQSCFDFTIPNYIIDEIIEYQDCTNRENLYYLINCAVVNGKITKENAKKIREVY